MPSLKDVKMKIVGVGKTKQITKAMNMVASAKLRGAQARIERFRPYAAKYRQVLGELSRKVEGNAHPLLAEHEEKKNCAIVMVTSDRGLCGSFNGNIISAALKLAKEKAAAGMQVSFACVGRKGRDTVRKSDYAMLSPMATAWAALTSRLASTVAQEVIHGYETLAIRRSLAGVRRVRVHGAASRPRTLCLLPLQTPEARGNAPRKPVTARCEYVYEPHEEKLLAELLPRYVKVQVYRGLAGHLGQRARRPHGRHGQRHAQLQRDDQHADPALQQDAAGFHYQRTHRHRRRRGSAERLRSPNMSKNIGKVVQVIGAVVDVEFSDGNLPDIFTALEITKPEQQRRSRI